MTDETGYITNMSRPEIADNKQTAEIAEAEASRNVTIRQAETMRESAQATAKADQERVLAQTVSQAAQAESQRDLQLREAESKSRLRPKRLRRTEPTIFSPPWPRRRS